MTITASLVMASFTIPEQIGTTPQSLLCLLPLVAAIAIVYKATKLPEIKAVNFIKEAVVLFSSIVIFMFVTALILYAIAWLVLE
jgi:hypothetical protein